MPIRFRTIHMALIVAAAALVSANSASASCRFSTTIIVDGPSKTKLPTGSRLKLSIYDANLADAPITMSEVVSMNIRLSADRFPVRVPVNVKSSKRCPNMPAVSASIERRGQLLFTNDTVTTVTPGKSATVTLIKVN